MSLSPGAPCQALRCWPAGALRALEREPAIVRIVLATVRGSAPREAGVAMLVTPRDTQGTIGGGQLEWEAVAAARGLLDRPEPAQLLRKVLGADLGQCCGGIVEVWMERYTRADLRLLETANRAAARGAAILVSTIGGAGMERRVVCSADDHQEANPLLQMPRARALPRLERGDAGEITLFERLDQTAPALWLYGAGHVGQALARIVAELPLSLTWIDSRDELFPEGVPGTVRILRGADPVESVARAPAGAYFLIMTHSHPLDYALCRAILERGDFAWTGLIGSLSKSARFRSRLRRDGVGPHAIARLVCPIGIGGIASKWPAAIAVAVAAQLLQDLGAQDAPPQPRRDPEPAAACGEGGCAGCEAGAGIAEVVRG